MRPCLFFLVGLLSVNTVRTQCPDGFLHHGSSCYLFSDDTEPWTGALTVCERVMGGYLAEIDSEEEDKFLSSQPQVIHGAYWIGGNDLQTEHDWKWVRENTDMEYTHWLPGNPSNSLGDEDCLELSHGFWNDQTCHKPLHYICEKDLAVTIIG